MVKQELHLSEGSRIAYHKTEGKTPTVIFCGGFKSDMTGAKAMALEAFCAARAQRFVRFDYTGHGASSGRFEDGTIGAWKQDALDIIDALGGEEIILIGSSMGAWISLLVAAELGARVKGFIGVASAPDFTEELIWKKLSAEKQVDLQKKGVFYAPSCYGEEPYPITLRLIEEARSHLILTAYRQLLTANFPIRLIHGTHDQDVPWQQSVRLMEQLESPNAQLTLIKGGDHRLSAQGHLQTLCETLKGLLIP